MAILATGYFLAAREGYRIMKEQALGGSIVFVASKNALAASPGASAYCTAKAAEVHLARCLALEGAPLGIRVNTVNPDAVLRGSKIWQGEWRTQRAASNKVAETELEEVYRQRSLLKLSVYPEDIAEAVYFFASDLSAKIDRQHPQRRRRQRGEFHAVEFQSRRKRGSRFSQRASGSRFCWDEESRKMIFVVLVKASCSLFFDLKDTKIYTKVTRR